MGRRKEIETKEVVIFAIFEFRSQNLQFSSWQIPIER